MKPIVEWLLDLGLNKRQVAKAVAGFPQICSIEHNVKPTEEWLLGVGLNKMQVGKAVAGFRQVLGYSIEQNLKPNLNGLLGVGLSRKELTNQVASLPQLLGLSIEKNLKTKLALLRSYFRPSELARLVATFSRVFYSCSRLRGRLTIPLLAIEGSQLSTKTHEDA